MLVKEYMHHPVITVHPETTMPEALDLMRAQHIRRLPVVDNRGHLVGIIAEKDLLRASPSEATTLSVWEARELTRKVTVESLMTHDVVTISDDTPLEEAARIMEDSDISGLPVTVEGKLVGIITESDLFKAFLEMLGGREAGVRLTILVPRGPGQLAKVAQQIVNLGGDIIALATAAGDNSETGTITVKVSGVSKEDLVNALTPMVLRITDVREKAS